MKNSISKRITLITFVLISIVFCLTFLFQNIFFEDFYLSKKTESLILDAKRIKSLYSYQNFDATTLSSALKNYEEKNNRSRNSTCNYLFDISNISSVCCKRKF